MIVEWVVYAVVVSGLVSAAAWLAERGARAQRWPVRWVWAAALAVSVAVPVVAWVSPAPAAATPALTAAPGAYVLGSIPTLDLTPAAPIGPSAEALMLIGWVALSAALLLLIGGLATRLWVRKRRWPVRVVDGVEVLVSRRTGPAALGFVRGRVVVPEWALGLDARQRRLLVLHEAEHVRAGDPQLAVAALLVCALAPWNLPLWWQLRRLRLAIEMDCDARVLRQADDARAYGSLLLEVGQHRAHLALALAEPRSMLERRIRMITETRKGGGTLRALGLAAVSGLVLAVACETPGPTAVEEPTPTEPTRAPDLRETNAEIAAEPDTDPETEDVSAAPTFTPMTDAPRLRNADQVRAALVEQYPPLLKEAGVEGTANLWFYILDTGVVQKVMINKSSGYDALDQAALRVADLMEFEPAYNGDERVAVWVALDITFEGEKAGMVERADADPTRTDRERERRAFTEQHLRERAAAADRHADLADAPVFTPMTQAPQLRNREQLSRLLQSHYPPLLRDAGIGGTASVWLLIDEEGRTLQTRINESSGHESLDDAALEVASRMAFDPAHNHDQPVAVWVALDVTFEVQ